MKITNDTGIYHVGTYLKLDFWLKFGFLPQQIVLMFYVYISADPIIITQPVSKPDEKLFQNLRLY